MLTANFLFHHAVHLIKMNGLLKNSQVTILLRYRELDLPLWSQGFQPQGAVRSAPVRQLAAHTKFAKATRRTALMRLYLYYIYCYVTFKYMGSTVLAFWASVAIAIGLGIFMPRLTEIPSLARDVSVR